LTAQDHWRKPIGFMAINALTLSQPPPVKRRHTHDMGEPQAMGSKAPLPGVRCMVFTTSDSRTLQSDAGGGYLADALVSQGHRVVARRIVADEVAAIRALVLDAVESGTIDVLLITGGTGVAPRDVTPDAVVPLFTKRLQGFGEVFRQLSFAAIGPEAILSRADAGVITRTLVFIVPGSPDACQLAMDRLIGPILRHAIGLLRTPD
jgi:molybdenum cofactor biosynthesis protein B